MRSCGRRLTDERARAPRRPRSAARAALAGGRYAELARGLGLGRQPLALAQPREDALADGMATLR
jgi:hypothetical protein